MAMQSRDAPVEGQWVLALGWIDMKTCLALLQVGGLKLVFVCLAQPRLPEA